MTNNCVGIALTRLLVVSDKALSSEASDQSSPRFLEAFQATGVNEGVECCVDETKHEAEAV